MKKCHICNKEVEEVCPDGVCKGCHKSVSWEDCMDGTWNANVLLRSGYPYEEVIKRYPTARIPKPGA